MAFLTACAAIITVGFVINLVRNYVDHRRYMAAHKRLRQADVRHGGGVTRFKLT